MSWLGAYAFSTPGVDIGDNATVRLDQDNEPQPDAFLRLDERAGGLSRLQDGYVEGPPELVVEIAASSVSIDLHAKLRAYRRNGVQEYLVWRVEDARVDWFALDGGEYRPSPADERGVVSSRVFPGLQLNVPALLSGDYPTVLDEQRAAIGTAQHRAFRDRLASGSAA